MGIAVLFTKDLFNMRSFLNTIGGYGSIKVFFPPQIFNAGFTLRPLFYISKTNPFQKVFVTDKKLLKLVLEPTVRQKYFRYPLKLSLFYFVY